DDGGAHCGRAREHMQKQKNLQKLLDADSPLAFWRCIRDWSDSKLHPQQVSASQLQEIFSQRLNPLPEPPTHFDENVRALNRALSRSIPGRMLDASEEHFFPREVTEQDVALAKKHIRKRHSKGAR
ncbi:hypothetical protein BT96DRAFT_754953, partial [Gymnopus androsaceus JB14]